jgi:thioredoxin-dependent peroxiredoxin
MLKRRRWQKIIQIVTLIRALDFKKSPKETIRGVFVVDKTGKVRLMEPGSPASTVY